jgi:hypothetical protein
LLILALATCASAPSVKEYIIDPKGGYLRAAKEKDDLPLNYCDTHICYGYEDSDVKLIKKYIVELEERLKNCER